MLVPPLDRRRSDESVSVSAVDNTLILLPGASGNRLAAPSQWPSDGAARGHDTIWPMRRRCAERPRGERIMSKPFTMTTVLLLLVVAAAHATRLAMNFDVVVDGYQVPMSASIAGAIITALLALLVWNEARR
jgi:hypothetical protein